MFTTEMLWDLQVWLLTYDGALQWGLLWKGMQYALFLKRVELFFIAVSNQLAVFCFFFPFPVHYRRRKGSIWLQWATTPLFKKIRPMVTRCYESKKLSKTALACGLCWAISLI